METYTRTQWAADEAFLAEPGQEVTEDIYNDMLGRILPNRLPIGAARKARKEYNLAIVTGFLMGWPITSDKAGPLFHAFGTDRSRFYYLGLSHAERFTIQPED